MDDAAAVMGASSRFVEVGDIGGKACGVERQLFPVYSVDILGGLPLGVVIPAPFNACGILDDDARDAKQRVRHGNSRPQIVHFLEFPVGSVSEAVAIGLGSLFLGHLTGADDLVLGI